MHGLQLQIVEAPGHPRRAPHPARQRLAVDDDAVARQDLPLTIERRLPGVLGRGDVGDQRRRRHAALDEPRRRRGLDDRTLAGAAGVFGTDRAQHTQPRGNPIERFAHLLADPMHPAGAARAECGRWLDHLFDPGQVRRQRADVAPGLAPPRSRRVRFRFVVVGRGLRACGPFQIERELLGADDRGALRSRAEDQALQRGDLSAQIIVFAVESQHHLGESRSVLGQIFRANRHIEKLHENPRIRQQNRATQPTFVGRFVTLGTTRDHSERPSISIASCAPVTRIVPSRTAGQAKPPSSSHFVARISPEPSKTSSFKRSDRFERNTKTSPL
jgi:hypothetical protein